MTHVPEPPRGPLGWIDDWWNPILVKEVRQALRGKFFRYSFLIVLLVVVVTSAGMLVDMGDTVSSRDGRGFFFGIFVCLAIAVMGLVPLSAYMSMGAEWEESTYDLLIISNLRPRQIVLGKLLSALAQALLYYSAFLPFLAMASLLRGVDLVAASVILGGAFVLSSALVTIALMMSTFSRVRFLRVVLMVALAALIVAVIGPSLAGADEILGDPGDLRDPGVGFTLTAFVLVAGILSAFAGVTACNMVSHAEENRSTGTRLLTSSALLATIGFVAWVMTDHPDREAISFVGGLIVLALLVPSIFFATEPEALGRRVAPRVPRSRLLALLATPFLPGGGRGMLLLIVQLATLLLASTVGHHLMRGPSEGFWTEGAHVVPLACIYAIFYVGVPSALFARITDTPRGRIVARIGVPVFTLLCMFLPALFGFFIGDHDLMDMEHWGHPFMLMDEWWSSGRGPNPNVLMPVLLTVAAMVVVLNGPRILRGIFEVQKASARARERARAERSAAPQPEGPGGAVAES